MSMGFLRIRCLYLLTTVHVELRVFFLHRQFLIELSWLKCWTTGSICFAQGHLRRSGWGLRVISFPDKIFQVGSGIETNKLLISEPDGQMSLWGESQYYGASSVDSRYPGQDSVSLHKKHSDTLCRWFRSGRHFDKSLLTASCIWTQIYLNISLNVFHLFCFPHGLFNGIRPQILVPRLQII